eukprot:scaffold5062_cov66-Attheya_sp.AAC.2
MSPLHTCRKEGSKFYDLNGLITYVCFALINRARLSGAASLAAFNTHPGLSYPSCVLAAVSGPF